MTFESYFSYGLNVKSFIHLPNLIKTNLEKNVNIREGKVRQSEFYKKFNKDKVINRPELGLTVRAAKNAFCFDWHELGAGLIQNGSEVTVEFNSGLNKKEFIPFITGPIFAVLLHQLNHLVLHASVVDINNRAILFLGEKGYGKSTLAAYLNSRGHQLISDDLAPIRFTNEIAETTPGYPQIRLFPDSVELIGINVKSLSLVNSWSSKRYVAIRDNFSIEPVKLGCIFVLRKNDEIGITESGALSDFIEITRNSYLRNYVNATETTIEHFHQCQNLVKSVPIFQLNRPQDFNCMQTVSEIIEYQTSKLID